MTPEEIEARFGKAALDKLYDCLLLDVMYRLGVTPESEEGDEE